MKLSVSNIAWSKSLDEQAYEVLGQCGLGAIEIAPTRIWPQWPDATPEAARRLRFDLAQAGLECSSVQSVLYGCDTLNLFGTRDQRAKMAEHLARVGMVAASLGAEVLVFGAPRNRDRGGLSEREAFTSAVEFFEAVGAEMVSQNVCLCLEPNPRQYDCNFIVSSLSGADLVRTVDSPGFRLHLDAAAMHLAGEDGVRAIETSADVLRHFHVSEPFLRGFENPVVNHRALARALRAIGWRRWISIEMRSETDGIGRLSETVDRVRELYDIR